MSTRPVPSRPADTRPPKRDPHPPLDPRPAPKELALDAEIDAYAAELVAAAPAFTPHQAERLRAIFAPAYERLAAGVIAEAA